jgi:uncharacterized protein YjbJ (UPF0337 family)
MDDRAQMPAEQRAKMELVRARGVVVERRSPKSEARIMDKDRIQGSVEQAKGKTKEVAGKVTGDAKLEAEGSAQKNAGKVQNAVGGIKDAVRDATK